MDTEALEKLLQDDVVREQATHICKRLNDQACLEKIKKELAGGGAELQEILDLVTDYSDTCDGWQYGMSYSVEFKIGPVVANLYIRTEANRGGDSYLQFGDMRFDFDQDHPFLECYEELTEACEERAGDVERRECKESFDRICKEQLPQFSPEVIHHVLLHVSGMAS